MTRYEVEWCIELPTDEHGEADYDRAKYACMTFETLPEARAYAKKIAGDDKFGGIAQIRKQNARSVNYHGHIVIEWETEGGVLEEVAA